MACIKLRNIKRYRQVLLDSCGRIIVSGSSMFDDTNSINTISFDADGIREGSREERTAINGKLCLDDTQCFTRQGATVTVAGCGTNFQVQEMLNGWTTDTFSSAAGTVWDDVQPSCNTTTLHEILWELPGTCDAAGDSKCVAGLVVVQNWHPTSTTTFDGATTANDEFQGKTKEIGTRLFELFPGGVPTGEFAHWAPFFAASGGVAAGQYLGGSWKRTAVGIDCPAFASTESCTLRPVVTV